VCGLMSSVGGSDAKAMLTETTRSLMTNKRSVSSRGRRSLASTGAPLMRAMSRRELPQKTLAVRQPMVAYMYIY